VERGSIKLLSHTAWSKKARSGSLGRRMRDLPREALNIEDLRRMARRRLTKAVFEFCDRGSEDEIAMRDNRAALDRIKLLPRMLTDVSGRDPGITVCTENVIRID
jgi:FMN-dependent dehydrogenase